MEVKLIVEYFKGNCPHTNVFIFLISLSFAASSKVNCFLWIVSKVVSSSSRDAVQALRIMEVADDPVCAI